MHLEGTMDLGTVDTAVVIALDVFDQFFKALYDRDVLPHTRVSEQKNAAGVTIMLARSLFDEPAFVLVQPEGEDPRTELRLSGTLELWPPPADPSDPDPWDVAGASPLASPALDIRVRLALRLVDTGGDVPVLGLVDEGIEHVAPDVARDEVENFLQDPDTAAQLAAARIEVVAQMVDGLEAQLFPDGNVPPRSDWNCSMRLLPGDEGATVDGVAVFVARPNASAVPPDLDRSPLAPLTEFSIGYSRALMDLLLDQEATAREGEEVDGAKITDMSMVMGDDAILVDGHAEKDDADIDFDGPVRLSLLLGTTFIWADTSDVDVDVDMPWYYYLGIIGAGILFFLPVVGSLVNGLWLIPELADASADARNAPNTVRGSLGSGLADGLAALVDGLRLEAAVGDVTVDSTPNHLIVENGHIFLFAQVFVREITEEMTGGRCDKRVGRMTHYMLESGRRFRPSELARMVQSGKITVPGHHEVTGLYLRSNPDTDPSNNLQRRFRS
jgi:hypothetical protein